MYMKKLNIIPLLFLLITFVSCNDFLDELPDNRAELDSKEKIAKLLVTAYPDFSSWLLAEFASDNIDENAGSYLVASELDKPAFFWEEVDYTAADSPVAFWDACYKAISAANHALEAIEKLGNEDGSMNHEKGEALLARAYGHFLLVNLFCQHYSPANAETDMGIPYIEKPETTVSPKYERGTVAEVYKKIEQDIKAGLPLIDDAQYQQPKYHFNRKAASAFAARFYLYYGKYEQVVKYADMVLTGDTLSVLRNWKEADAVRNGKVRGDNYIAVNNPANLLLTVTNSDWPITHGPYLGGAKYCHNRKVCETETTKAGGPWGTGNFYYQAFSYSGGLPKYVMLKYMLYFEYTDQIAGIGFRKMIQADFTTDETLLCRAEAYAMLGNYVKSTQDIVMFLKAYSNSTVTRELINNYYSSIEYYKPDVPTPKKKLNPVVSVIAEGEQENFIHCILQLRRVLTLHEGLRWYDVKRYGIEVYRRKVEGNKITYYDDYLKKGDLRRAIQLPSIVISAGLEPNPISDKSNPDIISAIVVPNPR